MYVKMQKTYNSPILKNKNTFKELTTWFQDLLQSYNIGIKVDK